MLIFLCSCKNNAQDKNEAATTSKNHSEVTVFAKTAKDSKRLTKQSLSSFFPKQFLELKHNGQMYENTSKSPYSKKEDVNYILNKIYGKNGNITIEVTDHANDQQYINAMKKNGRTEDANETETSGYKTYKDDSGFYIFESFKRYSGTLNRSTVVVSNPRFDIQIKSGNQGTKAYKPETLLKEVKKTNLFKLFDLPIPDKEIVEEQEERNVAGVNQKVLNCDELLPIAVVNAICNKKVGVKATSFEKRYNCNRFYPDNNSSGSLIFMVTQYSKAYTANNAVKITKGKEIENLGDNAIYMKEKSGDEYLKVRYKNYLLELRSTKNFDKEGVCYTEKELINLMKGIINRL